MRRTVLTALLSGVLGLALATAPTSYADPAAARAQDRLVLQGHGYGHGHGMSQWGAEGAAREGRSYRQILRFYYPGTRWGRAQGAVKVLISGDTTDDLKVRHRSGLVAKSLGNGRKVRLDRARPQARTWRITAASPTRSKVSWRGGSGGWRTLTVLRGDAQLQARGPIRLVTPTGTVAYRGALRSASATPGRTTRDTVNVLPLDQYLRGVVPSEVIASSWHPQTLRAQAVAARTYAAYERGEPLARHYQICDTAQCQVYTGAAQEYPTTDEAIRATRGEVLEKGGKPAFTQFSASNGGWTAAGSFGYLPAKQDPYDGWAGNPYHSWTTTLDAATIEAAWPAIGDFTGIEVLERDGNGDWGGRVDRVRVSGTDASTTVSGDTFRSYFGLRSDWFRERP
ncbi:SpoIID/LytB domain-containing protein [Nocardioides dongkuii]|uniref:SpoIID/LytB domain-containing protein n=1 Tax=Nocardioides dongkuii TaxID=2760089 RepID=UPI0015FACEB5|nr:SpoIID/LytB domain-containing protein [Nocardioides dongkuii]